MAVQLTVPAATAPPPPDLADLGGLTPLQGFDPIPMILELYFNPWHKAHFQATAVVSPSGNSDTKAYSIGKRDLGPSGRSKIALSKVGRKEIGGNPLWHSPLEVPSSVHPEGSHIRPCNKQSRLKAPIRHILVWRQELVEQFDNGRWDSRPRGAFLHMDFDSIVT